MGIVFLVFNELSEYDSIFFTSLLQKIENPSEYFPKLNEISILLKKKFPAIKLVVPPTICPMSAFLQGVLLPNEYIKEYHLVEDEYKDFGLEVFVLVPEDFQEVGIKVYDSRRKINWNKIPDKYRHCLSLEGDKHQAICTHHSSDINKENCVIGVLNSAFYLYQEYKKFDRTKKFNLDCHAHGYRGEEKNG